MEQIMSRLRAVAKDDPCFKKCPKDTDIFQYVCKACGMAQLSTMDIAYIMANLDFVKAYAENSDDKITYTMMQLTMLHVLDRRKAQSRAYYKSGRIKGNKKGNTR